MVVVVFTVVFWVFELSWLMYTYVVLADAANEGVRYAVVHSGGDPTGTQSKVLAFAGTSLHNVSGATISVTFPDGDATPPSRVLVTVSYAYIPFLPQFITGPTMTAYAEGRMVVQ
jgi:Flp pilus assembly protein TadG